MKLRGPGDIDGTRQSGLLDFKLADLSKDDEILFNARKTAEQLLLEDPEIAKPEHQVIRNYLKGTKYKTNWSFIS